MVLGQVLSQSASRNDHYTKPVMRPPASQPPASLSKNLNRLLSAAVVSPRFQRLLLTDPVAALAAGYNGESFPLTQAEYAAVTSLCVGTIRDFASQLLQIFQQSSNDVVQFGPEPQPEFHFAEVGKSSRENSSEPSVPLSRKQEVETLHNRYPSPARLTRCNSVPSDGYRATHAAKRYGS
jgi:hypothetical protein